MRHLDFLCITGSVTGCRSLERLAREQPLKDFAGEAAIRFASPLHPT